MTLLSFCDGMQRMWYWEKMHRLVKPIRFLNTQYLTISVSFVTLTGNALVNLTRPRRKTYKIIRKYSVSFLETRDRCEFLSHELCFQKKILAQRLVSFSRDKTHALETHTYRLFLRTTQNIFDNFLQYLEADCHFCKTWAPMPCKW